MQPQWIGRQNGPAPAARPMQRLRRCLAGIGILGRALRSLQERVEAIETLCALFQRETRSQIVGLARKMRRDGEKQRTALAALQERVAALEAEMSRKDAMDILQKRIAALEHGHKGMQARLDDFAGTDTPDEPVAVGERDIQQELAYLVSSVEELGRHSQRLNDTLSKTYARMDRLRRQMEAAQVSILELPKHQRPPRRW